MLYTVFFLWLLVERYMELGITQERKQIVSLTAFSGIMFCRCFKMPLSLLSKAAWLLLVCSYILNSLK